MPDATRGSHTTICASDRSSHAARFGRPILRRTFGLSLIAVVTFAAVEIAIRVPLIPLPNPIATYLYSCYETVNPDRYLLVPLAQLGLFMPRPGFDGRCYFNLKAGNHQVIGTSQMYKGEVGRDNGIESVKTNGGSRTVKEV